MNALEGPFKKGAESMTDTQKARAWEAFLSAFDRLWEQDTSELSAEEEAGWVDAMYKVTAIIKDVAT